MTVCLGYDFKKFCRENFEKIANIGNFTKNCLFLSVFGYFEALTGAYGVTNMWHDLPRCGHDRIDLQIRSGLKFMRAKTSFNLFSKLSREMSLF